MAAVVPEITVEALENTEPPTTEQTIDTEDVDAWGDIEVTEDSQTVDLLRHRSHALVSAVSAKSESTEGGWILSPRSRNAVQSSHFSTDAVAAFRDLVYITSLAWVQQEPVSLAMARDIFHKMDADGDGTLTMTEIEAAMLLPDVQEFIEEHSSLLMLKDPSTVKMLFTEHDNQQAGDANTQSGECKSPDDTFTIKNWMNVMGGIIVEHALYLKQRGLMNRRHFWAHSIQEPCICGQDSFWADFWTFTKNNHSFLGIFLADREHPLSCIARINIELLVLLNGFRWALYIQYSLEINKLNKESGESSNAYDGMDLDDPSTREAKLLYMWTFLLVTLPAIIIPQIFFYLLACPCMLTQTKKRGWLKWCSYLCWCGAALIGFTCLFLMVYYSFVRGIPSADDCARTNEKRWAFTVTGYEYAYGYGEKYKAGPDEKYHPAAGYGEYMLSCSNSGVKHELNYLKEIVEEQKEKTNWTKCADAGSLCSSVGVDLVALCRVGNVSKVDSNVKRKEMYVNSPDGCLDNSQLISSGYFSSMNVQKFPNGVNCTSESFNLPPITNESGFMRTEANCSDDYGYGDTCAQINIAVDYCQIKKIPESDAIEAFIYYWLLGTTQGWMLAPLIWLSLGFNPAPGVLWLADTISLLQLAGFGQWQLERRKVREELLAYATDPFKDLQLPSGWDTSIDPATGKTIYCNTETGQQQFEHPAHADAEPETHAEEGPDTTAMTIAEPETLVETFIEDEEETPLEVVRSAVPASEQTPNPELTDL